MTVNAYVVLVRACAAHLFFRALLTLLPFKTVLRIAQRPRRSIQRTLPSGQIVEIVHLSSRLCRGTCLSEALVAMSLGRRHGLDLPLTIGISLADGTFRAHAWNVEDSRNKTFAPLWRSDRRP